LSKKEEIALQIGRYLAVLPVVLFCLTAIAQTAIAQTAIAQKAANPVIPVPVTVTNTTANPVHTVATVSGTVAISGTPNVNIGTPTVNVGTMPPVTGTVGISGTPTVTLGAGSTVDLNPSTTVGSADTSARSIVRLFGAVGGLRGRRLSNFSTCPAVLVPLDMLSQRESV
jgi:hypothetical protein